MVGVWIGKQQVQLVGTELLGDGSALLVDLAFEVGVVLGQLLELDQVASTPLESIPGRDQLAVFGCLAGRLAGAAGVIPRAGLGELCV